MPRRFLVRLMATLAIALSLGFSGAVAANASVPGSHFTFLDLEDDDGDGIPNYLDPDDDNDGVTDEDSTLNPVGEGPDTSTGNGSSNAGGTTPTQAGTASHVTTLPNTGTGFVIDPHIGTALMGVSVLLLSAWAVRVHLQDE